MMSIHPASLPVPRAQCNREALLQRRIEAREWEILQVEADRDRLRSQVRALRAQLNEERPRYCQSCRGHEVTIARLQQDNQELRGSLVEPKDSEPIGEPPAPLIFNAKLCRVYMGSRVAQLSRKTYRLLAEMASTPGAHRDREELEAKLWPGMQPRVMTNVICRMRTQLARGGIDPKGVVVTKTLGLARFYEFVAEVGE